MEAIQQPVCCTSDGAKAVLHLATRYADAFQPLGQLLADLQSFESGCREFQGFSAAKEQAVVGLFVDMLCLRGDQGAGFVEQLEHDIYTRHVLYWYFVVATDIAIRSRFARVEKSHTACYSANGNTQGLCSRR